ncbi:unnamed protein product [Ilex paraguariensis]|uniref:Uncharacterized protein n=1 Tax=Ilex paraguariensis TaxID=185542 RepID=A0ABC8QSM5_9AQUA
MVYWFCVAGEEEFWSHGLHMVQLRTKDPLLILLQIFSLVFFYDSGQSFDLENASALSLEGLVDKEKLDSFNVPCYAPLQEEVQDIVDKEGSFAVEHIETFTLAFVDNQESDTRAKGEELDLCTLHGLVDKEKLDSFNVPCYAPLQEEVQDIVDKEGSFAVEHIETFTLAFVDNQESDTRAKGEELDLCTLHVIGLEIT